MSRHYLWLSARSWIVLLFSTAVSFVAVSVGSGYASQLISFDRGLGGIRGGDFNYCLLGDEIIHQEPKSTYGCIPIDSHPGGDPPHCPESQVAHMADSYAVQKSCTDNPAYNNDKECSDPTSVDIWKEYECDPGNDVLDDKEKELDPTTDTWGCTKDHLNYQCINCTNGTLINTETIDDYDCIEDDPE